MFIPVIGVKAMYCVVGFELRKVSFLCPASRHLTAKRHSWTERDSGQFLHISSDPFFPEMTHQVRADVVVALNREHAAVVEPAN